MVAARGCFSIFIFRSLLGGRGALRDAVIVIGGGIAGIQASLDLANAGCKVVLVERGPSIGGKMAALDKNFPTLDCSICIEAPKMSEVINNANIEVLTLAEVAKVEGQAGDFNVTVDQKPRYVTSECTRCNECVLVCPQTLKNEFDVGMAARKAIYTPFEQAEPGAYVIDAEHCLNEPPNYLPCIRCIEACPPDCIDFNMTEQNLTRNVAAIIVATGFDMLDPMLLREYGYGKHPDILTSLEFERLLQASGPSKGEIVRPSDRAPPESLLFVLCAGSRDRRFCKHCSRVCCMYSIKEAVQAIDHGIKNVTVLYMDIRAYGKGFDEFYLRSKREGVKFVRGKPAEIFGDGKSIRVRFENTNEEGIEERTFDMVVLAPALIPSGGLDKLAQVLGVDIDEDGFIKASETRGDLIATTRDGIFAAGCCAGPKDIADSVTEAGGAASYALNYATTKTWPQELKVDPIDPTGPPKIGVFLCDCGSNIAGVVNVPEVLEYTRTLEGVEHAERVRFACAANTQELIARTIKEKKLNRLVVAACSPKTHGPTFQRVASSAGLNPYLFEMANVRNQSSWVHKKYPKEATLKAKDLVGMSIEKAKKLKPLQAIRVPVVQRALVVGGGVAGMTSATHLAKHGFETHLVERASELGGTLLKLTEIAPGGLDARELVRLKEREMFDAGVHVHTGTTVELASGFVGNFNVHLTDDNTMDVGSIVLATGAEPYQATEFGHGSHPQVITSLDLEKLMIDVKGKKVTIVACVGSRNDKRGCSRFCCQTMLTQAVRLRDQGNRVRVLYKDIRAFTRFAEEAYEEASRKGVQFFQFNQDMPPERAVAYENGRAMLHDELSGLDVTIPTDLLVLNIGVSPEPESTIAKQLRVSRDSEGFLLESHPKLGPAETAIQGIFLAGTAQGAKDVRESVAQALAASAKAARILSRAEIEQEPIAAVVDYDKCTLCARCVSVCPYSAIRGEVRKSLEIVQAMCMGCGACAAECAVDAIETPGFTDEQLLAQINAATAENAQEKVIVFACNWCSYAGADQAGISKIQYPPSSRIIRTMCSARVSQKLVFHALGRGAGAVLVTGCHPADCHYINANLNTQRRSERWHKTLETRGIDARRLQLWWVSAAEGKRFAEKLTEMDELIHQLSKAEVKGTPAKFASFTGGKPS
jgi:heterodisulfide reductase subunit A